MSKPHSDMQASGVVDAAPESRPSIRELGPDRWLAERFRIESRLGAGGMGHVFRAFDRVLDTSVALKVIGELNSNSVAQIKREFRSAAELVHPNLVRLHELFCDGSEWFFTMDLVEGALLSDLVSPRATPNFDELGRLLGQLALGLRALHRARTLHGDLKPTNVIVRSTDGRVVLLDFGLARPLGPAQRREFAGTPAYMAPEQALGEVLTEAADWYSFGVVLYEAMTGALPPRRRPLDTLSAMPAELSSLCEALLALDPKHRPSGDEVLDRIGAFDDDPRLSTAPPTARAGLVDRKDEMASLDAALEASREGPRVVVVHGPSGIGKSALIEKFLENARRGGATVFAGKCRENESIGYKTVDVLLDDLVVFVNTLDKAEAAALVPAELPALVLLFQGLRSMSIAEDVLSQPFESLDPSVVRQRAFTAFGKLLAAIRRHGPLIVWVDDLQWSDRESALLLGPLLAGPNALPFLFVASHRGATTAEAPLLEALFGDQSFERPEPTDIELRPLAREDSERLALGLLRPLHGDRDALASGIVHDAEGHPLFITELAHLANESDERHHVASLSELIGWRVAALEDSARILLEMTAVAGVPLPRSVLRLASGLDAATVEGGLDVLRAARLAKSRGPRESGDVDIHHDRIREVVMRGIAESKRRHCHQRLGTVLELEQQSNAEILALHFEAAGERRRATVHFVAAGDHAFNALAFGHAAQLYGKAEGSGELVPGERARVRLKKAEALAYAGNGVAAADAYLAAAEIRSVEESLDLKRRAAEQLLLCGHLERGFAVLESVLSDLGLEPPRAGPFVLFYVVTARLLVRARGFRHVPRTEREVPRQELARIDVSWTLSCSLAVLDLWGGAEYQSRHLLLALRAGEPRRLLRALTLEVSFAATSGSRSEQRTSALLEVADRLAASHGDPAAEGLLRLTRGIAAYLQERIGDSVAHCEAAVSIFTNQCSGAIWETVTAHRFAIAASFFLGRLRNLAESVPQLSLSAESSGNVYAAMCFRAGYSTVAWLARGLADDARRQLDRTRRQWPPMHRFQLYHYNLLVGDTFHDLYVGDARRAYMRLVEQWPLLEKGRMLGVGVLRVQLRHFRATAAAAFAALADAEGRRSEARTLRAEARDQLRQLHADPLKRAAPLAALTTAKIDLDEGSVETARRHLEDAARHFREQELALFAATAELRLGELLGGTEGRTLSDLARRAFVEQGVVDTGRMIAALGAGV